MKFNIFLSKVSRRLGLQCTMYGVMKRLPLTFRRFEGMDFDDAVKLCNDVSPDEGGSCICNRKINGKSFVYDLEIIIPVYNVSKYVEECVGSVLGQVTRFTYHVTLIDDGSTDGSRELLRKYEADSRVTVIDQSNKGVSAARNAGLDNICGKYVLFVDSDDVLPPGAVETLMSKAIESGFDIVAGGYVKFFNDKELYRAIPGEDDLFGIMCGKVYRASLFDGLQLPEKYWFEDTINPFIMYDLGLKHIGLPQIVYRWRSNRKGITYSSIGNPKVLDTIYVTLRLMDDRISLGLPMDGEFYENLLYQFKENALRVYTLGNEKINYANFVISKTLYNRCYAGRDFHSGLFREIEEAVKVDDYKQFMLACIYL